MSSPAPEVAGEGNLQLVRAHSGSLVLYNSITRQVSVVRQVPRDVPLLPSTTYCLACGQQILTPRTESRPTSTSRHATPSSLAGRSLLQRSLVTAGIRTQTLSGSYEETSADYFEILSRSVANSPTTSRPGSPSFDTEADATLSPASFLQGYYSKFFIEERKLGKGARGTVFLCKHVLEGQNLGFYALKKITVGDSQKSLLSTLKEVKHLENLRHANIVAYHHSWLEMHRPNEFSPEIPHLFLLLSFANGGSLENFIALRRNAVLKSTTKDDIKRRFKARQKNERLIDDPAKAAIHYLRVEEISSLFKDISAGLEFLHSHDVLHLDLKADNVLLHFHDTDSPVPIAMLSDFGSSETSYLAKSRNRTGFTGTIGYVAPEIFLRDSQTARFRQLEPSADLWALGLLLHLLCYFCLPFLQEDSTDFDTLQKEIADYPGFITPRFPRQDLPFGFEELMSRLINRKTTERPSASEVLRLLDSINLEQPTSKGVLVRRNSPADIVHQPNLFPSVLQTPSTELVQRIAVAVSVLTKMVCYGPKIQVVLYCFCEVVCPYAVVSVGVLFLGIFSLGWHPKLFLVLLANTVLYITQS